MEKARSRSHWISLSCWKISLSKLVAVSPTQRLLSASNSASDIAYSCTRVLSNVNERACPLQQLTAFCKSALLACIFLLPSRSIPSSTTNPSIGYSCKPVDGCLHISLGKKRFVNRRRHPKCHSRLLTASSHSWIPGQAEMASSALQSKRVSNWSSTTSREGAMLNRVHGACAWLADERLLRSGSGFPIA